MEDNMAVQSNIIKSVRARFAPRISQPSAQNEEQLFLTSIAHLTPEEQYERRQHRAMYQRMAQRQGIMEVEQYTKS
jgi:hypothetical protein